jgi:hypothetical protein
MSRYYGNYSQYLGAQRCCNLNSPGPQGIVGPTGPASIGPMGKTGVTGYTGPTGKSCRGQTGPAGPTQINTNVIPLELVDGVGLGNVSVTVPAQLYPIQYYYIDMTSTSTSNNLTTINFDSLPMGYQANFFINGDDTYTHAISHLLTPGILLNYNTPIILPPIILQNAGPNSLVAAFLTIYSLDGVNLYGVINTLYN